MGVPLDQLGDENVEAVRKGCANLARHLRNIKTFGVPVVVAINQFINDTEAELNTVRETAKEHGTDAILASHWANGGAGTEELAQHVADMVDSGSSQFAPLYDDDVPLWDKIKTVATHLYDAEDVIGDQKVRNQVKQMQEAGYGHFPVCMAKTQYSFSTDPNLKGAPTGHTVPIREVRLSAGAEFIVVICGEIMTMPGLPRVPAANSIYVNDAGEVEGLF